MMSEQALINQLLATLPNIRVTRHSFTILSRDAEWFLERIGEPVTDDWYVVACTPFNNEGYDFHRVDFETQREFLRKLPDVDFDSLPELTPEEKAACDKITPDLVDRLFREADGSDELSENDCQRADALAAEFAAGVYDDRWISSLRTVPSGVLYDNTEDMRLICKRLIGLRKSYVSMQESLIKFARSHKYELGKQPSAS